MQSPQNHACTGPRLVCRLLSLTWTSRDRDLLQHVPAQYLHFVADEYFHNEQSLFELRNSFLDLLGDVFFVVPGLVTARYHRGESPSHPPVGPQRSEAGGLGSLLPADRLPAPPFWTLTARDLPRCLGYNPACQAWQFPCLSEFRNVAEFLFFPFRPLLQDHGANSHLP